MLDGAALSMRRWLLGQAISMAVIFLFSLFALLAMGMPYAILLSVVAGLLTFVPTLGPFVSGVVITLAGLSQSPTMALYGLLAYLGIQFLESNLITPVVQEQTVKLPPAATLALQLVAGLLFGLLGLAFIVPLAAAGKHIVQELYVNDCLGGGWSAGDRVAAHMGGENPPSLASRSYGRPWLRRARHPGRRCPNRVPDQAASISCWRAAMCGSAAECAARSIARKRLTTASPTGVSSVPPPLLPPGLRRDQRLAEDPVHVLDQIPGVLVGHLHVASGSRNRSEGGDVLEQFDLPRTDPAFRIEIDPQTERRHGFDLRQVALRRPRSGAATKCCMTTIHGTLQSRVEGFRRVGSRAVMLRRASATPLTCA